MITTAPWLARVPGSHATVHVDVEVIGCRPTNPRSPVDAIAGTIVALMLASSPWSSSWLPQLATLAAMLTAVGCGDEPAPSGSPASASIEAAETETPEAPAAPSTSAAAPPLPEWASAVSSALERAATGTQTLEHVRGLTDAAGPRLAGSVGDRLAVAWALGAMPALGLSNVRAEPVTVAVWQRGEEHAEIVAPTPQVLAAAALGGSVGTPEGGLEAEVVRVDSLDALRARPRAEVEGRIVLVDQVMARSRDGSGYGAAIGVRIHAASEAARLGAVAVLIRSIGTDSTRFPHTGVMHYADDAPRIPAAALANPDADVLARAVAAGAPVRVHLVLGCHDAGTAESANVVGEVPGADPEHASEIVLLGAHLDSWDLGRGAIDDGAGVAIVLEVARQIAASPTPPRRTIRVVLFANEENGGAGADAYALEHAADLARHVVAVEADFGDGRAWGIRTPDAPARSDAWARVVRLLEPLEVEWDPGVPDGGADIGAMHAAGVPALEVLQDGSRYFDLHHTANDVLTEVDQESLDAAMRAYLVVAYATALDVEGIVRPSAPPAPPSAPAAP